MGTNMSRQLRRIIRQLLTEHKLRDRSIVDVLALLKSYGDYTWVFYDTETTGLDVHVGQLTQIAGLAVTPDGWNEPKVLGQFDTKIKLNADSMEMVHNPESRQAKKWSASEASDFAPEPQKILTWQRYEENGREYEDEKITIDKFLDWIKQFPNPMLIAQNAAFDMKWINVRYKVLSDQENAWSRKEQKDEEGNVIVSNIPKWPVLDTMQLTSNTLIPMLQSLSAEGDEAAAELLAKLKNRAGKYSSSMGIVAKSFGIDTSGHHDALQDSEMMMDMFLNIYRTIETASNIHVDISTAQGIANAAAIKKKNRSKVSNKKKRKSVADALKQFDIDNPPDIDSID